jgi:hypothetical protein
MRNHVRKTTHNIIRKFRSRYAKYRRYLLRILKVYLQTLHSIKRHDTIINAENGSAEYLRHSAKRAFNLYKHIISVAQPALHMQRGFVA